MNWHAFTFESVAFTALGAIFLWGKLAQLGRKDVEVWGLGFLWKMIGFKPKSRVYKVLEFVTFVGLGTLIGVAIVVPVTPAQCLSTGLGWTGLGAAPKHHH